MNDATPLPQLQVIGRLADAYVAYLSLADDMTTAGRLLEELGRRYQELEGEDDDAVGVALWSAAVIGYGRCFGGGRRKGYADTIEIPAGMRTRHRWVLDHRNDHIAHLSHNNEEDQVQVVLWLEPADGPAGVAGAGFLHVRMLMGDADGIAGLRELAAFVAEAFATKAEDALRRIVEVSKALPLDRLYRDAAKGRPLRLDEDRRM